MTKQLCVGMLWISIACAPEGAFATEPDLMNAPALPMATKRLPASAEECEVWRTDLSAAQSVQDHDEARWAAFNLPGAIFGVGTVDASRGNEEIRKGWPSMSGALRSVVRWRPGLAMIGGDPRVAVTQGPYLFHGRKDGVDEFSVGIYQSVWVKDAGVWHILFDGDASTEKPVADLAAGEAFAAEQPMSDCYQAPKAQ